MGFCTARIQLLVLAAAASRTLRRAAAAAAARVHLWLAPHPQLAAHCLSPLLTELCTNQLSIELRPPLAAAPDAAAFVAATDISTMRLRVEDDMSSSTPWHGFLPPDETEIDWLATCSSVTKLEVEVLVLPAALPPNLQVLKLEGNHTPFDVAAHLTAYLGSLSALQHLELGIDMDDSDGNLPAHIQWPSSLKTITISFRFMYYEADPGLDLAALCRSNGCNAAVSLDIDGVGVDILSKLVELDSLDALSLSGGNGDVGVQPALAQVTCRRFTWTDLASGAGDSGVIPQLPQAEHVALRSHLPSPDPSRSGAELELRIFWTALSSRPGSFCICVGHFTLEPERWIQIKVIGVPVVTSEPHFMEPWAIWVEDQAHVQGLPWHCFQQLPSGWWAWRNAAAARLGQLCPEGCGDQDSD